MSATDYLSVPAAAAEARGVSCTQAVPPTIGGSDGLAGKERLRHVSMRISEETGQSPSERMEFAELGAVMEGNGTTGAPSRTDLSVYEQEMMFATRFLNSEQGKLSGPIICASTTFERKRYLSTFRTGARYGALLGVLATILVFKLVVCRGA
jgi:hypothetical protein